jgi:hypothetical protein
MRSNTGGVARSALLIGLLAVGLAGCGGDDTTSTVLPVSRLPDPCRLLSVTQLRQDLDVDFEMRAVSGDRPDRETTELGCSWIRTDAEGELNEDYLDDGATGFIDVVVRRSDDDTGFDAAEFYEEVAGDEQATERPELVGTDEATQSLADAAVSVGATLFVLKDDVVLTVSTDRAETLEELIPDIVERVIRRI